MSVRRKSMEYTLREGFSPQERAAVAARILNALPEWFGIPESTAQYVEGCKVQKSASQPHLHAV